MALHVKKYSVLLLYPEGEWSTGPETYFAHVEALSPERAVTKARWLAVWDNQGNITRDEFTLLAVFRGHLKMELCSTSSV